MLNTTTVDTAPVTCSARPRTTGSVAITAADPQIALPAPMSCDVSRSNPNSREPIHHDEMKVLINTRSDVTSPAAVC